MPDRVLATARNVAMVLDDFRPQLEAADLEVVFPDSKAPTLTEAELLSALPGSFAAISMPDPYTARVLEQCAPQLKLIARSGVGYDSIDLDAARKHGVWVTTTIGSNHDAVADFALGLILDVARRLQEISQHVRAGEWRRFPGFELRDKVLGIVGTGRVGREVATRASAFGMRIVAHDLYPSEQWAEATGAQYLALDELLAQSDVVTLHAPATPQTRHLINARTLAHCKRGVVIVNTARGDLIDEAALLAALESGQCGGAGLDVFSSEPPDETLMPLIRHPRVVPTAHCAGSTTESQRRSAQMAVEEVLRVRRGERPKFPVPELG
jgi:D-3-phosphoglycerate dehydrogenase